MKTKGLLNLKIYLNRSSLPEKRPSRTSSLRPKLASHTASTRNIKIRAGEAICQPIKRIRANKRIKVNISKDKRRVKKFFDTKVNFRVTKNIKNCRTIK